MRKLFLLLGLAVAFASSLACARLAQLPESSAIVRRVARALPRNHLKGTMLNEEISRKAWTNFIQSLDFDRVYFYQSDIDAFEQQKDALAQQLENGDAEFAYTVFNTFLARLAERQALVGRLLDQGFDFSVDEYYLLNRRHQPWPANDVEAEDLWRRRLKNDMLRLMLAREQTPTPVPLSATPEDDGASEPPTEDGESAAQAEANAEPAPEVAPAPVLEPHEVIARQYRQLLTVMNDYDADWVLERYLTAFSTAFDPHSTYMSPSALEDFNIEMSLSLVGIGALLSSEDGAAKIIRIIPGGPADRDDRAIRLRPNDKIIAVAQGNEPPVDVLHLPLARVVRMIRGDRGTPVVLTVVSASDPTGATVRQVDLVRDEVKLEEQAAELKFQKVYDSTGERARTLGVIRLPTFYANMEVSPSDPDFRSATHDVGRLLKQAREENVDGLVLDLRNNSGGALSEAIHLVGLFIPVGPCVQIRERYGVRALRDNDPAVAFEKPLVVLVNRLSASASEIVAGALRDYGRAVIVGDSKTHGKGTVQKVVDFGDGRYGALKVTSATFYRVTGASTQLKGIEPDILVPSVFDTMSIGEEEQPNALPWTTIPAVSFRPVQDISSIIPVLRERFESRKEASERFRAYRTMIERLTEINRLDEVSLSIEKRRKDILDEMNVFRLRDSFDEDGEPQNPENGEDIVLDEAFNILSDLIEEFDSAGIMAISPDSAGRSGAGSYLLDLLRAL